MDIYYVENRFIPADKAVVSANDLIVLRGFGVFDFMITYNKKPFHLNDHIRRFFRSATEIGIQIRQSPEEIRRIVGETIQRNSHQNESYVRLVYTGGVSADSITPENNGHLLVMVTPKPEFPRQWYTEGVKIITMESERQTPTVKSTNYTMAVLANQEAKRQGANEVVYTSHDGKILEGTTSNFFLVKSRKIITPGRNILSGITREVVLGLIKYLFEVEIRDVPVVELKAADEAFFTASNKEVVPVVTVNNISIGKGKVGPVTQKIMTLFRDYTEAYGRGEIEQK